MKQHSAIVTPSELALSDSNPDLEAESSEEIHRKAMQRSKLQKMHHAHTSIIDFDDRSPEEEESDLRTGDISLLKTFLLEYFLVIISCTGVVVLYIYLYSLAAGEVITNQNTVNMTYLFITDHFFAIVGLFTNYMVFWYRFDGWDRLWQGAVSASPLVLCYILRDFVTVPIHAGSFENDAMCTVIYDGWQTAFLNFIATSYVISLPFYLAKRRDFRPHDYLRLSLIVVAVSLGWLLLFAALEFYFSATGYWNRMLIRVIVLPIIFELFQNLIKNVEGWFNVYSASITTVILISVISRMTLIPTSNDPLANILTPVLVGITEFILRFSYFARTRAVNKMLQKIGLLPQHMNLTRQEMKVHRLHAIVLALEMVSENISIFASHFLCWIFSNQADLKALYKVPVVQTDQILTSIAVQVAVEVIVDSICVKVEKRQGIHLEKIWKQMFNRSTMIALVVLTVSAYTLAMHAFQRASIWCPFDNDPNLPRLPLFFWLLMIFPAYKIYQKWYDEEGRVKFEADRLKAEESNRNTLNLHTFTEEDEIEQQIEHDTDELKSLDLYS